MTAIFNGEAYLVSGDWLGYLGPPEHILGQIAQVERSGHLSRMSNLENMVLTEPCSCAVTSFECTTSNGWDVSWTGTCEVWKADYEGMPLPKKHGYAIIVGAVVATSGEIKGRREEHTTTAGTTTHYKHAFSRQTTRQVIAVRYLVPKRVWFQLVLQEQPHT